MLPLIGIPLLVGGFALRLNPLLVVLIAGITTALAVGMAPLQIVELIGDKFLSARSLALFILILPMIGLLERHGLREQAARLVSRFRRASAGGILLFYFVFRQFSAAIGLPGVGGQVSMVRPLLVPMLEGAASVRSGKLPERTVERIRAEAAAVENIALFFGEDIFIALGAVLLMDAFLRENGIKGIDPIKIGLWAIPSAIAALLIHSIRLVRLDAKIALDAAESDGE
ncbi:MAG: DUF969 domain-containing protein [Caulobacteraceae bacterium]|nr:DUF969 domain-containing protein [Caulobacteraceae bacterium]